MNAAPTNQEEFDALVAADVRRRADMRLLRIANVRNRHRPVFDALNTMGIRFEDLAKALDDYKHAHREGFGV